MAVMHESQRETAPLSIAIAGGGTAGWMAAAALSKLTGCVVTLIESDAIGTVGVGEATIPQIIRLYTILGLDENAFLRATSGTFKLGIEFVDWGAKGSRYLHTFGETGMALGSVPFHHYWRRSAGAAPDPKGLWDYSLHQMAASAARFGKLDRVGKTNMTGLAYAYHFDASRYALFLRAYAEGRGVTRTEGIVETVQRDGESGDIASITLKGGKQVDGDFFIDCTGFRSVLMGETLGVGYEDWSKWLPCDRALAVPSERLETLVPYTRATARQAGWQWRIPLQHRTGNDYVHCSQFISEDEAAATLLANLDGKALADPRPLRFVTGKRREFWKKNCVAIGLSAGFMEPLESTSLHLIQYGILRLIALLPDAAMSPLLLREYNAQTAREYELIRDFLILHYKATTRDDSELWRYCAAMPIPDSLQYKIDHFRAHGTLVAETHELFANPSWIAVYLGQSITPERAPALAHMRAGVPVAERLAQILTAMDEAVAAMPSHGDFIARHCAAPTLAA